MPSPKETSQRKGLGAHDTGKKTGGANGKARKTNLKDSASRALAAAQLAEAARARSALRRWVAKAELAGVINRDVALQTLDSLGLTEKEVV